MLSNIVAVVIKWLEIFKFLHALKLIKHKYVQCDFRFISFRL